MKIEKVHIKGFRNFEDEEIVFQPKTLIIGANDVGKTNLLYALRILFDKSISEHDLELNDSDYNAYSNADTIEITATICDVTEDCLLSTFGGAIKDGSVIIRYTNSKNGQYSIWMGYNEEVLAEYPTRQYIKRLNMQYVDTNRDLFKFLKQERMQILQISKELLKEEQKEADEEKTKGRLSHKLDFGNEWFGMPCSDEYWEAVEPVFDLLKQEKNYGTKWSEIADKSQKVYIPLLQAFIDEINRANEKDQTMPRKMIEYLIGIEDYYKVVSKDSKRLTMIHTFNMHDTLNKPAKNKVSAITVPIVKLPTRLVALEFKPGSDNTVEMYLDNGWQLSFRIHNASTKVEPSLKFDVQFVSMPMEVLNIECRWN